MPESVTKAAFQWPGLNPCKALIPLSTPFSTPPLAQPDTEHRVNKKTFIHRRVQDLGEWPEGAGYH